MIIWEIVWGIFPASIGLRLCDYVPVTWIQVRYCSECIDVVNERDEVWGWALEVPLSTELQGQIDHQVILANARRLGAIMGQYADWPVY